MILTHLVMFKFWTGASASSAATPLSGITKVLFAGLSKAFGLSNEQHLSEDQN